MALDKDRITTNYEQYRDTLAPHVSDELLQFLNESDMKTAPASTRDSFHGAYEGGLVEHSLGVLLYLRGLNRMVHELYSEEQIVRTALLHDICKVNCYRREPGWRKSRGEWEQYSKWVFEDPFPAGHGPKSVALVLMHGTRLTDEEVLAITHHMGAYNLQGMELQAYQNATKKCPLVLLTNWADLCEANIRPFMQQRRDAVRS